jgi:biopolymer transport protein ExbB
MESMTFAKMMQISIAMPILLVLSFLVLGQAFERLFAYFISLRMPSKMWERIHDRMEEKDRAGAIAIARKDSSILGVALAAVLTIENPTTERIVEVFQVHRQRFSMALNRRVGMFGTASFVSPLIGLMGTVLGIMRAFHDLSAAGSGGPAVVAMGISEALVTTASGIGLAVVSALLYNYFTLESRHRLNTADLWVLELAEFLERMRV